MGAAQPAALKLLKGRGNGTDSAGRPVRKPPPFKRLAPKKPTWLSSVASEEWDRVLPEMERLELLKEVDGQALASYCECFAVWRMALEVIQDEGMMAVNTGSNGSIQHVTNPAVATFMKMSSLFRQWCCEFGFTPSSEQRLGQGGESGTPEGSAFD